VLHGAAEAFLAAEESLLGEVAHRGIGEAGRWSDTSGNLLKSVPAESSGGERLACLLDSGVGLDRLGDLGEPADELDPAGPAGGCLADEHGSAGDLGTYRR
jgi:hypothetical protein